MGDGFGRGFFRTSLQNMRMFFLACKERLPEKCQMASGIFPHTDKISQTTSGKSAAIVQTLSAQLQVPPEKLINRQANFSQVWLSA
jgi:hypothetical protein